MAKRPSIGKAPPAAKPAVRSAPVHTMSQYERIKDLPEGDLARVRLMRRSTDQRLCAVKTINVDALEELGGMARLVRDEPAKMAKLGVHPNIVAMYCNFSEEDDLHYVYEYCDGGDLATMIKKHAETKTPIPDQQIRDWFIQVVQATMQVHKKGMLHRHIKAENILLIGNQGHHLKLAGFSVAQDQGDGAALVDKCHARPPYVPPEYIRDDKAPFTVACEVWAIGVLLYQAACLKLPFLGPGGVPDLDALVNGRREPLPETAKPGLQKLIDKLLDMDPAKRPLLADTLNDEWVLAAEVKDTAFRATDYLGKVAAQLKNAKK